MFKDIMEYKDNYIILKENLFTISYLYVDSDDYYLDELLIRDNIDIKFICDYTNKDTSYLLIYCKVKKHDAKMFELDLEELKKEMLIMNKTDYIKESKAIITTLKKDVANFYSDNKNDFNDLDNGYFNYRIVEKNKTYLGNDGELTTDTWYDIHEIFYTKSGTIIGMSENPATLYMESYSDLKNEIKHIKEASKKKILTIEKDKLVEINKYIKDIK